MRQSYHYMMAGNKSKNIFSSLLYILIVLGISNCYSKRYFATPDYFTRQSGTLILKNGEKITGEISVNNLFGNSVIVHSHRGKKEQAYHVQDVEACWLEIGVFEPKLIGSEIPGLHSLPVFMEKLTPDSFSISLYESYQKVTDPNLMGNVTVQTGAEFDLQYFVHLPYDDSSIVWGLSTFVLTAHLSNGLDSLFRQCPGLTEKIRSGDPAYDIYFSPQVKVTEHVVLGRLSTAAKAEKVKNIIRVLGEYESCRSKNFSATAPPMQVFGKK